MSAARHGASEAIARSRQREEAFRISSAVRPVAAGVGEPSGINRIYRLYREEGLHGAQATGPEARRGVAGADPGRIQAERLLVGGFLSMTSRCSVAGGSAS